MNRSKHCKGRLVDLLNRETYLSKTACSAVTSVGCGANTGESMTTVITPDVWQDCRPLHCRRRTENTHALAFYLFVSI